MTSTHTPQEIIASAEALAQSKIAKATLRTIRFAFENPEQSDETILAWFQTGDEILVQALNALRAAKATEFLGFLREACNPHHNLLAN